jgi:hypothetical protein
MASLEARAVTAWTRPDLDRSVEARAQADRGMRLRRGTRITPPTPPPTDTGSITSMLMSDPSMVSDSGAGLSKQARHYWCSRGI